MGYPTPTPAWRQGGVKKWNWDPKNPTSVFPEKEIRFAVASKKINSLIRIEARLQGRDSSSCHEDTKTISVNISYSRCDIYDVIPPARRRHADSNSKHALIQHQSLWWIEQDYNLSDLEFEIMGRLSLDLGLRVYLPEDASAGRMLERSIMLDDPKWDSYRGIIYVYPTYVASLHVVDSARRDSTGHRRPGAKDSGHATSPPPKGDDTITIPKRGMKRKTTSIFPVPMTVPATAAILDPTTASRTTTGTATTTSNVKSNMTYAVVAADGKNMASRPIVKPAGRTPAILKQKRGDGLKAPAVTSTTATTATTAAVGTTGDGHKDGKSGGKDNGAERKDSNANTKDGKTNAASAAATSIAASTECPIIKASPVVVEGSDSRVAVSPTHSCATAVSTKGTVVIESLSKEGKGNVTADVTKIVVKVDGEDKDNSFVPGPGVTEAATVSEAAAVQQPQSIAAEKDGAVCTAAGTPPAVAVAVAPTTAVAASGANTAFVGTPTDVNTAEATPHVESTATSTTTGTDTLPVIQEASEASIVSTEKSTTKTEEKPDARPSGKRDPNPRRGHKRNPTNGSGKKPPTGAAAKDGTSTGVDGKPPGTRTSTDGKPPGTRTSTDGKPPGTGSGRRGHGRKKSKYGGGRGGQGKGGATRDDSQRAGSGKEGGKTTPTATT